MRKKKHREHREKYERTCHGLTWIHKGLNIKTSGSADIKAAQEGRVVFSSYLKGWGQAIIIKHDNDFYTIYANLDDITTKEGKRVKRGEVIAKVGSNKNNSSAFHFEIRKQYVPQDPLKYLK